MGKCLFHVIGNSPKQSQISAPRAEALNAPHSKTSEVRNMVAYGQHYYTCCN